MGDPNAKKEAAEPVKDGRACALCKESKARSEYSESQWYSFITSKCKVCVGTTKFVKGKGYVPKRRRLTPSTLATGESAATILERRRRLIGDSRDPPVLRGLLEEIQRLDEMDI